mgnify:CR=1 FL=1
MDKEWFNSKELCYICEHEKRKHEGVGSAGHCHDCEPSEAEKLGIGWGTHMHNFNGKDGLVWPRDYECPLCKSEKPNNKQGE